MGEFILAIDQGTTSSRAIVFDAHLKPVAVSQREFSQHYPRSGWVEHDPEEIWSTTVSVCRDALNQMQIDPTEIAAIGMTNQRETTIVWDRATGAPIYPAIVWQDRRTSDVCNRLRAEGFESMVTEKTGLRLDSYFSATKIGWILDHVPGARDKAEVGALLFGTIDSFLLWRLTGGAVHATDATNASRTMLYNIRTGAWDNTLLDLFRVPRTLLPTVLDCADDYGSVVPELFGVTIPIRGVAGDQQAAAIGQTCFWPGMLKATYGTGCFALLNTGRTCVRSQQRLLSTIAYRLDGQTTYALEGSIFVAGAVVQWLRDGLKVIQNAADTELLAEQAQADTQVYLVPAFTGLGAPYWDSECRGALFGLTRDTGFAEVARAALRSVAYQTRDLYEAMRSDWDAASAGSSHSAVLRVDGGMVANDWMVQSLSDILQAPVDRPEVIETTALGAAWLAGMQVGLYPKADAFSDSWALDRHFEPEMSKRAADTRYAGWRDAVSRVLTVRPTSVD
ncbi:MAG: glycerol kinase GlpK [Litorivicinaceae bacterium]|nr:glycerol kinase GlpK [Litorivicinaceae bacterium]MDP5340446.1 glycerol kinase GlpK [Litorivicinaceae bacterium]MDP5343788.1 glycerol kinase GlpK [Litorivicinaceae bacterium]MDP5363775.1 glycerol kinase GlpK [Litorivicinaceae bacterium]